MSVLNDIGKKLGEAAEIAANKAKEVTEIAKLNSYISAEEKEINKIYCEIGKLVYEQSKDEAIGHFGKLCKDINESKEKIAEYKNQIEKVKSSSKG